MVFSPAVREQRLVLEAVAGIAELATNDRYAGATPDTVDAVLEGIGQFAEGEWAPLNKVGDTVGAKWTPNGVVMPEGYRQAYHDFVEGGWGTIAGPEDFGGQGLPFVLQTAVLETLGTANMGFALGPILTGGAVEALLHHGTPEQQAAYLPKLVTGAWTGTMNLTEPQAGSDVGALRSRAEPAGDGQWRVSGTKIFISFGDHDLTDNIVHLVLARTPDAPAGTRGISLFLVPKVRAGRHAERRPYRLDRTQDGTSRLADLRPVSFGDHNECLGELIGAEGGGMRAMFTMMNNARLNVGLQGVQVAEAATQRAVAYARDRIQGARSKAQPIAIIEHPDVRRMLLRMKAQTIAARALVYAAASQVDRANLGDAAAKDRLEVLTPLAKAHAYRPRLRGREHRCAGSRRHGLHRGDGRGAILSRCPDHADL